MLARLCAPRARSSPWPLLGLASLAAVGVAAATPAPDWRPPAPPADATLAQDSPPPPSAPVAARSAPSPVPAVLPVPTLSAEPPTEESTLAPASSFAPAPSPASSPTAATVPSPSSSPAALAAAAPRAPPVAEPAGPAQPPQPTPTPVRAAGPSRVQAITHSLPESRFEYRVNGQRQVILGMGYNARYGHLPPERRARRMQRDFARMAAAGVNTVQGWDMQLFDEVLLDAAAMNGLGVILPFELDPELNYRDRGVRARLMAKIEAWVQRYRDHPALRMWALGNEVLHKMIRPTWLGGMRDKPEHIARARAFSDFLLAAAQRVWELDPNHPLARRSRATWSGCGRR